VVGSISLIAEQWRMGVLKSVPLLSSLTTAEKRAIAHAMTPCSLDDKEAVFKKNDLGDAPMQMLRLVTPRFGAGRQKRVLVDGTNPKLSRRTCTSEYGLHSWRGKSAGVAKRPRERSPPEIPTVTIRDFLIAVGHWLRSLAVRKRART
jgi:hypothetical protein